TTTPPPLAKGSISTPRSRRSALPSGKSSPCRARGPTSRVSKDRTTHPWIPSSSRGSMPQPPRVAEKGERSREVPVRRGGSTMFDAAAGLRQRRGRDRRVGRSGSNAGETVEGARGWEGPPHRRGSEPHGSRQGRRRDALV